MPLDKNNLIDKDPDLLNKISDATIASLTTRWGMGGGTVTSLYGWLCSNGAAIFVGIVLTLLGFIINLVFQYARDKRSREEHKLKVMLLELEYKALLDNQSTVTSKNTIQRIVPPNAKL